MSRKSFVIMKVASFFAGVGGIDFAFRACGFDIVWANELDRDACQTYRLNFDSELVQGDIRKIRLKDIPDFDVMVGGFPCQAFSVAGLRKGFADKRGNLFFELERIFRRKKPKVIFLENVKNLVGHDNGNTFRIILDCLKKAKYHVKYQVLNACEYGNLPQNRERIYIVAFRDKNAFIEFDFPEPIELTNTIASCINRDSPVDDVFYYTPEKYDCYDTLKRDMTSSETLYQWRRVYVRANKNNLCPTLTANMGMGGHNVPLILTPFGIRKLTPRECFNFMGFPATYNLPDLSLSQLYKQAGNSVAVPVVKRIADNIGLAISSY